MIRFGGGGGKADFFFVLIFFFFYQLGFGFGSVSVFCWFNGGECCSVLLDVVPTDRDRSNSFGTRIDV